MSTKTWSCSFAKRQVEEIRRSSKGKKRNCWATVSGSVSRKFYQTYSPSKQLLPHIHQACTSLLTTIQSKQHWECGLEASREPFFLSSPQSSRRHDGRGRFRWLEQHDDIIARHMKTSMVSVRNADIDVCRQRFTARSVTPHNSKLNHIRIRQASGKEGQRWGLCGHTIMSDNKLMCPKGEIE